jgi:cardiolipin synthase
MILFVLTAFQISWDHVIPVLTTIGGYLLAFFLIPRIVLDRRESGATLAWILVIALLPYLGAALFFLVGRTRIKRRTKRRRKAREIFLRSLRSLVSQERPRELPARLPEVAERLAALSTVITDYPPVYGNSVELFIDANKAYDSMLAAIASAKHHVFMMSYIFRDDRAGHRFRDLLIAKAKQGVRVHLLVDGIGSQQLSSRFTRPLEEASGQYKVFMPVWRLRPSWRPNLRNHRKILVVDSRIGFAGGLNIGEEYQGRKAHFAPWRDTHLKLEGPAVRRLQEIFIEDWLFASSEDLTSQQIFKPCPTCGEQLVQVIDSGPDHQHETIHAVFFTALTSANSRVYITTPYFVPGPALLMALKTAAWRGVDVRLLVPGKSDMRLVQWAGRSFYKELIETGVRIYEHRPGILHAKTMVVDGLWSTVGSANMDQRSFHLNFEINVSVIGKVFADRMERIFKEDIARAHKISIQELDNKKKTARMIESICRILSPVL